MKLDQIMTEQMADENKGPKRMQDASTSVDIKQSGQDHDACHLEILMRDVG